MIWGNPAVFCTLANMLRSSFRTDGDLPIEQTMARLGVCYFWRDWQTELIGCVAQVQSTKKWAEHVQQNLFGLELLWVAFLAIRAFNTPAAQRSLSLRPEGRLPICFSKPGQSDVRTPSGRS